MIASADDLRILSLVSGRMRLHLPGWTGSEAGQIENRLRRLPGVESVRANTLTGNVLIHFDPGITGEQILLAQLRDAWAGRLGEPRGKPAAQDGIRRPIKRRDGSAASWVRVDV